MAKTGKDTSETASGNNAGNVAVEDATEEGAVTEILATAEESATAEVAATAEESATAEVAATAEESATAEAPITAKEIDAFIKGDIDAENLENFSELIEMVRCMPQFPGGPTEADVHPDEVAAFIAADWLLRPPETGSGDK